jgi:sugar transferase EpsL
VTSFYEAVGKRAVDMIGSIAASVLVLPVALIAAAAIQMTLGSPILFLQRRPGKSGQPFTNLKFRTMSMERDGRGNLRADADRLGRLGRFLRASSLDELPELWNVLRGDMSLVGPRPLLMQYLDRYTPEQARRHEVKPGITGWAQVNGRNALSWEDKFRLDVWYVDNCSFWLDVKILAMTVWTVLRRESISQPGHATAEEFKGSIAL